MGEVSPPPPPQFYSFLIQTKDASELRNHRYACDAMMGGDIGAFP